LEKEIGVTYPWQIYKQIPVEDFLYAGMENTTATIFAQNFVVDSIGFNDRNYVNVNAHELAHQWFGDMITATSGKHHWLQEGFATYYALLAEREVFGNDYFYYKLYQSSLQLKNAAKTDTIPVLNEKASSLSFYQKGAWALHVIRESIGAKAFQKAVKNYLKKHAFKNVETEDFLAEVRKVSHFDTEKFRKQWLEDYRFNSEEVNALLNKNAFVQQLVKVQKMRNLSLEERWVEYNSIMKSTAYFPVKSEILYQLKDENFRDKKELLFLALQTNDIKVRQSVAEFTAIIPFEFKTMYETLLNDDSYDTREIALIRLFNSFPESQAIYLEKAKNWMGNNDLGLRTTVLFLSQNATGYDANVKSKNLSELIHYTSPHYESSTRQNAFQVAVQLPSIDIEILKNLVNATTHFKWQFNKYAKEYIRSLLKTESYRLLFEEMLPQLPDNEKIQLEKLLYNK
jgi:aminopeptidase N